ncbi:MAG: diacylglycerol kinase family protein [Planctomycetota bacterium]
MPNPAKQLGPKFAHALRGMGVAFTGRNGFGYHAIAAVAVVAIGVLIGVTRTEWLILTLCITIVISAELMNTSIEHLAKAVTTERHPEVRNALDIAAGAVLAASIGAKVVWVVVLAGRLVI